VSGALRNKERSDVPTPNAYEGKTTGDEKPFKYENETEEYKHMPGEQTPKDAEIEDEEGDTHSTSEDETDRPITGPKEPKEHITTTGEIESNAATTTVPPDVEPSEGRTPSTEMDSKTPTERPGDEEDTRPNANILKEVGASREESGRTQK